MPTPTKALVGEGAILARGDGALPEVFGAVAEVVNITGPDDETALIDATNMDSQGRREFISGLIDGGEVTVEMNMIPDDASQVLIRTDQRSGVRSNWRITWPNTAATKVTFQAIVRSIRRTTPHDTIMRQTAVLKVTGDPTWA